MPSWNNVSKEIQGLQPEHPLDIVRQKYLRILSNHTKRNTIAYYSAFLQKDQGNLSISEDDKNALMQCIYGLDKQKGLDLILHTPGGDIAATESIVSYLRSIFGNDIRVIVPQLAMSAGTMIALSSKEIIMGKQSCLGPIDPQIGNVSCWGIVEEFQKAQDEIIKDPRLTPLWQTLIAKYPPGFVGDCEKANQWSKEMVTKWLKTNMLSENSDLVENVVEFLGRHDTTYSHSRRFHIKDLEDLNLNIKPLEEVELKFDVQETGCKDFQDCILTIHHAFMHTFNSSPAVKIVENNEGNRIIFGFMS